LKARWEESHLYVKGGDVLRKLIVAIVIAVLLLITVVSAQKWVSERTASIKIEGEPLQIIEIKKPNSSVMPGGWTEWVLNISNVGERPYIVFVHLLTINEPKTFQGGKCVFLGARVNDGEYIELTTAGKEEFQFYLGEHKTATLRIIVNFHGECETGEVKLKLLLGRD
jgi:hypothetical protein